MTFHLYNSLSNSKEAFSTIDEHLVRFYACGPTVYDHAHVGHARATVAMDLLRRYLEYLGYHVLYVSNFTDIDDKIINRANELDISTKALSERYIASFVEDMAQLNVRPPSIQPRATETIDYMIKMIQGLLDTGHAYECDGEVIFDVSTFPKYRELANIQALDEEEKEGGEEDVEGQERDGGDAGAYGGVGEGAGLTCPAGGSHKRNPRDFVLWKPHKPGEPAWDSPWGKGRPGWHIECSAMNLKFLGPSIDIHGGGQDLIFPHHTNEIAQSEAYTGQPFCRFWVHNGFVQVNKEKMSKSLGNFFTVKDILERYSGEVIRLFLISTQYRHPIDFSEDQLEQAQKNHDKLQLAYSLLTQFLLEGDADRAVDPALDAEFADRIADTRSAFRVAMDDDLNTPRAMAAVYGFVKLVVKSAARAPASALEAARDLFEELMRVLGLFETAGRQAATGGGTGALFEDFSRVVSLLLDIRAEARQTKDWATADRIRDDLAACHVIVDDGTDHTTWRYAG